MRICRWNVLFWGLYEGHQWLLRIRVRGLEAVRDDRHSLHCSSKATPHLPPLVGLIKPQIDLVYRESMKEI